MKKKVLFFIESLQCGGAEKSLISLLPLLDYSKMDVDLMLLVRGGVFEQYVPKQVHITDFRQQVHPLLFLFHQTIFSLRLRWNKLIGRKEHGAETRWITMHRAYTPLEQQYDVAIAYQQGFPTYYIISKVTATRKFCWINADLTQVGYKQVFNRPFYKQADEIVPVSERLKDILVTAGYIPADKQFPVYDIVNPELIRSMAHEPQNRMRTAALKLVTVGRMVHLKGYDQAVMTAKILRDKGLNFCWYFIGDGEEKTNIKQLIDQYGLQDSIQLLGEQPNPYPFMNACDIYMQTSRNEGFCLTIAEAKILHKPVISTNFPVVHNQIVDGENGLIADMTPDSIAEKIILLARDTLLREQIIHNISLERNNTAEVESAKVNQLIIAQP